MFVSVPRNCDSVAKNSSSLASRAKSLIVIGRLALPNLKIPPSRHAILSSVSCGRCFWLTAKFNES